MDRKGAEALGWVLTAVQPEIGYVIAEKLLPNGDLIHQSGVNVDETVAAIDAWESYPIQAVDTRDAAPAVDATGVVEPAPDAGPAPVDPVPDPAPEPAPAPSDVKA